VKPLFLINSSEIKKLIRINTLLTKYLKLHETCYVGL
jgi:hypothetical protein